VGTTGLSWVPVCAVHRSLPVLCVHPRCGCSSAERGWGTAGAGKGSGLLLALWPPARLPQVFPLLLLGRQGLRLRVRGALGIGVGRTAWCGCDSACGVGRAGQFSAARELSQPCTPAPVTQGRAWAGGESWGPRSPADSSSCFKNPFAGRHLERQRRADNVHLSLRHRFELVIGVL